MLPKLVVVTTLNQAEGVVCSLILSMPPTMVFSLREGGRTTRLTKQLKLAVYMMKAFGYMAFASQYLSSWHRLSTISISPKME
jgi:hypothetical protein